MNRIKMNDNLGDFKNILNTFKQKILIISIFTLIVFVLVFFVGSQVNKNASFKAKTLIDCITIYG